MASVREVYNALKDIANKDQRGFVTPTEFNSFAPVAQTNIYNKMFSDFTQAKLLRAKNLDAGRDKSRLKQLKEDLSIFSKKATVPKTGTYFAKPDDLGRFISAKTYGNVLLDVSTSVPLNIIYDEEKLDYTLRSTLSKPTLSRPVAFIGEQVEVYPTGIKKIDLRYYKLPEGLTPAGVRTAAYPRFGFTVLNNKEAYDNATSVDFELPEHYTADIVAEMATLIGINLRDPNVYAYGTQGQAKAKQ